MLRATGAGKVEVDTKYSSPGMLKALLYNFDFDDMSSTALKPEHIAFLKDKVVPLLADERGQIWLRGSASKVGAADYNRQLSKVRVERVAAYLAGHGIKAEQMQLEAVGEDLTVSTNNDDERDRAVTFIVLPRAKVDPPPPPKVIPKPTISRNFKLTMLMALAASKAAKYAKYIKGKVGAGIAGDVMFFQIWDTQNNLAAIYVYVGGGIGVGLSLPASGTLHGPWNPFTTTAPISCAQFDGPARFTTAGAGPYTVNWINLIGTPPGVEGVYMMIETGTTIGAGASSTIGAFILLEGPDPFSGP